MNEFLRISSGIWSMVHVLLLFIISYAPKFSRKKTNIFICATMIPLLIMNILVFVALGQERYGKMMELTFTLPSFLLFLLIAKHPGFRFAFTFCLVNTISAEIIILSVIFNFFISPESNMVMFINRIVGFSLVEFVVIKWVRKPYFEIQEHVENGWPLLSAISAVFLVLIVAMATHPTVIWKRPEDIPVLLVILATLPLIYVNIFQMLSKQNQLHVVERERELWQIQAQHMQQQIRQFGEMDEQTRIARHDLRHRLSGIDVMLQKGQIDEARHYITASLEETVPPAAQKYCQNVVLDAIFNYYFRVAQDRQIITKYELNISDHLPVEASELSVVVANALENAIHACEGLPKSKRIIWCRCIEVPQFMLQINNPYVGEILVDEHGVPTNSIGQYGIGTRSILAFCEKHGAFVNYKIGNGVFSIRVIIQQYPGELFEGGG